MKFNIKRSYDHSQDDPNHPVFLISENKRAETQTGHVYVQPAFIREDKGGESDTFGFYHDYLEGDECVLSGLVISCQFNLVSQWDGDRGLPYAWKCGYENENFNVEDIDKAIARVTFLKRINKMLKKHIETFGIIRSFDEYVMAIANIIGVKTFIRRSSGQYIYRHNELDAKYVREYISNAWSK